MRVNWKKKNSVTLLFLVTGPLFLFFEGGKELFNNGIAEGLLLSLMYIIMPATAVFLFYWPFLDKRTAFKEVEESKVNPEK